MREYYKMATQQKKESKGAPVGVIVGVTVACVALTYISYKALQGRRSS